MSYDEHLISMAGGDGMPDHSVIAQNVGEMEVGQWVAGEYGAATVLHIEVSKWRFSEKPKHIVTLLDHSSGEEYTRGYFPWSPIKNNHAYEAKFNGQSYQR